MIQAQPRLAVAGGPRVKESIPEFVVRMANENVSWGYRRIEGAPQSLGHLVSRSTIARTPDEQGAAPQHGLPSERAIGKEERATGPNLAAAVAQIRCIPWLSFQP